MELIYYLQNGIMCNELPEGYDMFYIIEDIDMKHTTTNYYYHGDNIQYTLDSLCVELYDVFQNKIFSSKDEYYKNYGLSPQWIERAGLDSDLNISKDNLAMWFSVPIQVKMLELDITDRNLLSIYQEIDEKKYKYAYTADCQSLINTLQELLCGIHSSFVAFYKHLCKLHNVPKMQEVYYECGFESRMVYSFLYTFVIQTYSTFDILTKIAYELENIRFVGNSYTKMASNHILYGDKNRLRLDKVGTIFEKDRTISIIESLRHEIVHNATWEMNPKIFVSTNNEKIIERYILLPDFTEAGTLVTFKNRKRFFSEGKTVNEELPLLYFDIMKKIQLTLERLNAL